MRTATKRTNQLLALTLAGDALISLRPPKFIRDCLDGVKFPREWRWSLIVIKLVAAAGLTLGTKRRDPAIGTTVSTGVLSYFFCAIAAHLRARFLGTGWLGCLGMTGFAASTLALNVRDLD